MSPSIISRHEIGPFAFIILEQLNVWYVVKLILELRIVEHVVKHSVGIAVPDLTLCVLLTWQVCIYILLNSSDVALLRCIPMSCGINCRIQM